MNYEAVTDPGPARSLEPLGRKVFRILAWLATAALMAGLALLIWGSNRGFDFSDEGVYLLDYRSPDAFDVGFTSYHRVGALLYRAVGGDIQTLRIIGALGIVFSSMLAGFAFVRLMRTLRPDDASRGFYGWPVLIMMGWGALMAYCWPPQTPSYNTFTGIGLLLAMSGVLFAIAAENALSLVLGLILAVAAAALMLLVKGSAAVGFIILSGGLFLFWPAIPWRRRLATVAGGLLLLVFIGAGIFFLLPGLRGSWDFLVYSFSSILSGGGASGLLARHAHEAADLVGRTVLSYSLSLGVSIGAVVCLRFFPSRLPHWTGAAVSAYVVAAVAGTALSKHGYFAGMFYRNSSILPFLAAFASLAILACGLPSKDGESDTPRWRGACLVPLVLWLAALPFVAAAGTTHRVYVNALLHIGPLLLAIWVLAILVGRKTASVAVPCVTLFALSSICAGQFFSGYFLFPYRLPASLASQSQPVQVGPSGRALLLDKPSAGFIKEIRSLMDSAGFRAGDDVLAFFDLPGVVYALGGNSPGRPWYFSGYGTEGDKENIRALQNVGADRVKRAYLLQTAPSVTVARYLEPLGIVFPGAYQPLGKVWCPSKGSDVFIWAPPRGNQ